MKRFVAIESPRSEVASRVASITSIARSPTECLTTSMSAAEGKAMSGLRVKSPVGVSWLLITRRVTPSRILPSASLPAATTRSQPSTSLASPAATRVAWMSSGRRAMRTWLSTAPPFCARPVMSSTEAPLPSIWLAMPRSAPIVTTPVPPTPVTRML